MKYYVYYGYISPDNCDGESTTHKIEEFVTPDAVEEFYKEWLEELNNECSKKYFRVFHGKELFLNPKETVTKYSLDKE